MTAKPIALLLSIGVLFMTFSRSDALAETVDFTDMDRGPSSSLYINGVTISTSNFGPLDLVGTPATVAGIGLGSATISPPGTVDRIQGPAGYTREAISLMVSGNITSITINPYFSIVGSNEVIFLPFDIYLATGIAPPSYLTVTIAGPITINLFGGSNNGPNITTLNIGLQSDFGNMQVQEYLVNHPGAVAEFGYSITSLVYTVPEGSTVSLFGIGVIGIAWLRRRIAAQAD